MDRDELWGKKWAVMIHALETYLAGRGSGDYRRKKLEGILIYLRGDRQAEEEFYEALRDGASLVRIPLHTGETGRLALRCCSPDLCLHDIELTIFCHQAWKCPRCGKVYALYKEAADGRYGEDD